MCRGETVVFGGSVWSQEECTLAMEALPGAHGRVNGLMTTALQAGFFIGPPLGGALVDYVVRDDFVINLSQRYIVTPRGHSTPIFSTWGLGSLNSGRSETNIRLTYQF